MNRNLRYLLHSGKNNKLLYYARQGLRCAVPRAWLHRRLNEVLDRGFSRYDMRCIEERVDYYCRLGATSPLPVDAPTLGELRLKGNPSTYFFDSYEIVRWFDDDLRWCYRFGDVIDVPPVPSVVKSRPIAGDNACSVLLNLDKCRHFVYLDDRIPLARKQDRVIFRGSVKSNPNRVRFMELFGDHPLVDAADTVGCPVREMAGSAPQISLYDHLRYKFIMALEGNDVASNLKWIMSSGSLAVTPAMRYETWFMEGRLQPDFHYVEVKPDFSDLGERVAYYAEHPREAAEIVAHANEWVGQFRDPRRERFIALLVMKRYFERTGQWR